VRWRAGGLALIAVAIGVASPSPAVAAAVPAIGPLLPLGHAGRWLTDADGRVVILHGTNMVYKRPPYYPAAAGFDNSDGAFLEHIGFDAVRLGVIWKALEPEPGVYDAGYLRRIAATVAMLARHRIVSLLDFHQDMLNEEFQGEGFPDWTIESGGLMNPMLGFPGNYLSNPALQNALDQFWTDAPGPGGIGLQSRFAAAWTYVATRFHDERSVLGYELFNEPFPGTDWAACAQAAGCPGFDAELSSFYRLVDQSIRLTDRRTLIFYEPDVLFNEGFVTTLGALGDRRAGFAFHDYCLSEPQSGPVPASCGQLDGSVFAHALAHVASTREALLLTEFGATRDVPYLDAMVARADRDMVPWLEWAFCGCRDPTTTGPGTAQAIVIDPAKPARGSNLVHSTLRALVEPYPQVLAGTPRSWGYDRATRTFALRLSTERADGRGAFATGSLTDVATPRLDYPRGYRARVHGAAIVSRPGAAVLVLAACRGARTISLKLAPGRGRHGSCRAPSVSR
jgi:endoglycosylceramidase